MSRKYSNIPKGRQVAVLSASQATVRLMAAKLQQGIAIHNSGDLEGARIIYEEVFSIDPNNFDALQLLGTVAAQSKKYEKAVDLFGRALKINNKNAFVLNNFGNALQELSFTAEALESFDRAISINSNFAEAHSNRGNVLQKLNREQDSVLSYDRAIEIKPDYSEAYFNRGNALRQLKKLEAAVISYACAIAISPAYAEAYFNQGGVLLGLKRLEEAVDSYSRCVMLRPDHAEAFCDRGNALLELKRLDEAVASYERAIALRPNYADAFNNCGVALRERKEYSKAVASYDQAIKLRPEYSEAYSNRGVALKDLQQIDEAIASYDRAIALNPKYAEAYSNRGNTLLERADFDDAIASYDKAIAIKPDYAEAYWNKSLILLMRGQYKLGWELYEWRWANEKMGLKPRIFDKPQWCGGENLAGKTILLHAEQGLGDSIQFCRYAALVKACGATVLIEVHQPLTSLFQGLPGVDLVIETGLPLPAFDFHCPMLSLPLAFNTNLSSIPRTIPYLFSNSEKRRNFLGELGEKKNIRVGLVWSGSTIHANDISRSLKLADLIDLLPPKYEYISLQKEVRETDAEALERSQIRDFSKYLFDFSDTAALCELLDIVISVDTSVAHLAGALGKATWLLLPRIPDWRWLLDREDSLWYPTMRLYRQGDDKSWATVLEKVAIDLENIEKVLALVSHKTNLVPIKINNP